ncbi:uncharacterized protein MONBRDRAFT_39045 [Monosiga brevicollis MX1]|uniref:Uncharacterized protein n=1 Tax=Monosiga brevicollis TaxID=81824 RepID=A9VBV7_MONBE|nr:uncharacterized protein MONBRDRAFT_39045 [Monosiga brevicollis MX1]EDQ85000.1 predicted protein [Monosiga brevicollis MX1]|eukprot:XP_001750170.1 hypothetical protein [Monosiga brevicollis MX1]
MDKQMFNLKLAVKQLERMAKKAEKDEKSERTKIKKASEQMSSGLLGAMEKGNQENARIHAENAIRNHNQHTQFLRMSARVDAVVQRVQTAITMQKVSVSMKGVVKSMDRAMSAMNLTQLSQLMEKFEQQFEDLDVQTAVMDGAMSSTTAQSMPPDQVDALINQVADEHGLELGEALGSAPTAAQQAAAEQDDLSQRLARLREQ